MMGTPKNVDVIVIGGGVIGCAIAFELAKYKIVTCLLEQEADLCFGASGANTGLIHAGFNPKPGSMKARFNVEGNKLIPKLASELHIPFKKTGALVLARTEPELARFDDLISRGEQNGVKNLQVINRNKLRNLEPELHEDILGALFAPTAGIISPYELTIALAENAARNGVKILLSTSVLDIIMKGNRVQTVITNKGKINSRFVINAGGMFSDDIAKLVGLKTFSIRPRRGEYLVLDKHVGELVRHTLFPTPSVVSKGIVVTPTVSGNILIGPNADEIYDKNDTSTTTTGLETVFECARNLVPALAAKDVISTYAGLRAVADTDDFIIGSTKIEGFVNAAGIASPGLTAAPAIAKYICGLIANNNIGIKLVPKIDYKKGREKPFNFISSTLEESDEMIKKAPEFGQIVCRCEHVSKGEVIFALNTPPQPSTLKGLKYRTRVGMGRCQGAFCTEKVVEILSKELEIPEEKITLSGKGSEMLFETKKGRKKKILNKKS